jgi:hypothetical protein
VTQLLHNLRKLATRTAAGQEVFSLPQRLKGGLEQMERRLATG